MKLLFVVNGAAGRVRTSGVEDLVRTRWGGSARIVVDPGWDELTERCAMLDPGGAEAIVAVGGDGTVNRVLNALGSRRVPLGILPLGRANDLARELGVPTSLAAACDILDAGQTVRFDLVSVNGVRFATCGGTDEAAAAAERAASWGRARGWTRLPARLAATAYAAAAVRTLLGPLPEVSFRVEAGDEVVQGRALAVMVSNQCRFGGRFRASPNASNRDGRLDLCVLPALDVRGRAAAAARCAWTGNLARIPGSRQLTGPEARILASRPVRFFGDGEPLARGRVFHLRVHPEAALGIAPTGRRGAGG